MDFEVGRRFFIRANLEGEGEGIIGAKVGEGGILHKSKVMGGKGTSYGVRKKIADKKSASKLSFQNGLSGKMLG